MDWNPPRPDEKNLRLEDYTLDFIPECVRRVQEDSGDRRREHDRLLHGRRAVDHLRGAACRRPGAATWCASPRRSTSARWRCSRPGPTSATSTSTAMADSMGIVPASVDHQRLRLAAPHRPRDRRAAPVGQPLERRVRQAVPDDGPLGHRDPAAGRRLLQADHQEPDVGQRACTRASWWSAAARSTCSNIKVPLLQWSPSTTTSCPTNARTR